MEINAQSIPFNPNSNMISSLLLLYTFLNGVSLGLTACPDSQGDLHRIGKTRYYIIQNTTNRGGFVSRSEAKLECEKHGLKTATIKHMLTMAVLGRELEKMAFADKMKDTWYWLDAKYDNISEKYFWGDGNEVKYGLYLYRSPRPIGVSSHITYGGEYQKDRELPQCLTLALPWFGSADHNNTKPIFFGHQATFDEKDCKSKSKRHSICESTDRSCNRTKRTPFTLDEGKQDYFENGNWIFGDRKYILNWQQMNFNDSEKYCQKLGLKLTTAGDMEKHLIPHIKMWSRAITAAHFWTSMKYNGNTKQFLDADDNPIANHTFGYNFTETEFKGRTNKLSQVFCVAMTYVYEFKEQMPCKNLSVPGCQWSFIRYAPANCNNYHGIICQHSPPEKRNIAWPPKFDKTNLTDVLVNSSMTSEFGYTHHDKVLRSKYKQTFGNCHCPAGYHMLRYYQGYEKPGWAIQLNSTFGRDIFNYDYSETYWVVDDMFNKTEDSLCLIAVPSLTKKGFRNYKEVSCAEWHFYLCVKVTRWPTKKLNIKFNKAPAMRWSADTQQRVYPLIKK